MTITVNEAKKAEIDRRPPYRLPAGVIRTTELLRMVMSLERIAK